MWTIFLDIDGTLLLTNGAGLEAIKISARELFGAEIELPNVAVHGRTDAGILRDLFREQTFEWKTKLPEFFDCYARNLRTKMAETGGMVYPGVIDFLQRLWERKERLERSEMNSDPDGLGSGELAIGLLTGNCHKAAIAKIDHFGLSEFVEDFGGFGDEHPDRNDVAAIAMDAGVEFLGARFDARKMWVVGDTPNDVKCGRSIGARVLAVATGGSSYEELLECKPDLCVPDLSSPELVDQLFSI